MSRGIAARENALYPYDAQGLELVPRARRVESKMYLGLWLGQGAFTVVKIASEDVCLLLVLDVNPAMTYF